MKHTDYCVLPFTGVQIDTDGSLKPCCKFDPYDDKGYPKYFLTNLNEWWSEGSKKLREGFVEKDISPACKFCFHGVDAVIGNDTKDFANSIMLNGKAPYYTETNTPEFIDIRFGNICNLKCIMCNPWASSQIANEYKNNKEKFNSIQITSNVPQDPTWWKNPEILEHLLQIVRKAKYVNFSGGEPLAIPELTTVLENIPRDCLVQMTTNITLLTDKHIELFNNLDDMRLQISLDGVGAHHEYVRHGSKWDDIHNNVQKLFKNYKHQFDFSYLLQATSVYSFPNFYNYLKSIDKTAIVVVVKSNTLAENGIMTVNSVLPEDVEKFKTWHENNRNEYSDTIDTWLSYYNFNQEAHEHFKKYVTLLDEIRGCDFRTTFNPSW